MANWQERIKKEDEEAVRLREISKTRREERLSQLIGELNIDNTLRKVLEEWRVGGIFGPKLGLLGYSLKTGTIDEKRKKGTIGGYYTDSVSHTDEGGASRIEYFKQPLWIPERTIVTEHSSLFKVSFEIRGPNSEEWIEVLDYTGDNPWNDTHVEVKLKNFYDVYSRSFFRARVHSVSASTIEDVVFKMTRHRIKTNTLPFQIHI